MEMTRQIALSRGVEHVWPFVQDLSSMLKCIPGARLGAALEGRDHEATITVNAGEFSVTFAGVVSLAVVAPHTAVVTGKGRDRTGAVAAEVSIRAIVAPAQDGTSVVEVHAEFEFSGVLAPAARAGAGSAASLLMSRFARCVESHFAEGRSEAASTR